MHRQFYISSDLGELEKVGKELIAEGLSEPQVHVLSENEAEVDQRQLHRVQPVLKQDVVHSTEIGALFGFCGATLTLLLSYIMGWHQSAAGWLPFVFLAVIVFAFCTWEGGFIGIQRLHQSFQPFQDMLTQGKHLLLVDIDPRQKALVERITGQHPAVEGAGFGLATPEPVIRGQEMYQRFVKFMP